MKKSEEVGAMKEGDLGLQLRSSMIPRLLWPNHLVRPATAYAARRTTPAKSPDSVIDRRKAKAGLDDDARTMN